MGKVGVKKWPQILHVAVDRPSRLTEEQMQQGVMIKGVGYEFTGLIHDRGEGGWDVSVMRNTGCYRVRRWHRLKKDSREEYSDARDILSEIVFIQLCAKEEDETESPREDVLPATLPEPVAFSVELVPHLKNGQLKICHLNASFVLALRAYPDLRALVSHFQRQETAGRMLSLVSEIEVLLKSTQETDLLGLKRVLQEMHPGEHAYDEGFAQEVLHQLLEDLDQTFTGDGRFGHVRVETEDKGTPPRCCKCRELLAPFSDDKPERLTILQCRPSPIGTTTIQHLIDKYEEENVVCNVWTGCLRCEEQQRVRAVSELKVAPNKWLMEFDHGATNAMRGFEEDVSWGLSTYEVTAVLHHSPVEEHFWASAWDGHTWWRIDDFCGDPNISRKKYVKRRGVLETTGDIIQRLDSHVLFVLLEKKTEGDTEELQVFILYPFICIFSLIHVHFLITEY